MSSVYFFLVAEASAISSAPNTMSRGTFFSRARTSTSITNSRLPATTGLLAATLNPSQFRHQPRPLDIVELQAHRLPFELHRDAPIFGAAQHPHEPAPPGRIRRAHPHVGLVTGKARKIAALAQWPVQTRGRHFEPVVLDTLDLQHPAQLPAYRRAVLDIDAAGLVDEQAQHPSPVRRLQLDELVPHAGHYRLHDCFHCCHKIRRALKQKMGRSPSLPSTIKAFEV